MRLFNKADEQRSVSRMWRTALSFTTRAMIRKALTILSLVGLGVSVGLWRVASAHYEKREVARNVTFRCSLLAPRSVCPTIHLCKV